MSGPCEIHPPPLNPSPIRSSMVCRAKIGGRLGGPVKPCVAHGGLRQVPDMVMMKLITVYGSLQFLYVLTMLVYTTYI